MNKKIITLFAAVLIGIGIADAQINKNSCKFLGNITTHTQIQPNAGSLRYENLWDQLTCENETKWGEVVKSKVNSGQEGVDKWNWSTPDAHYRWCKANGVLFKFHCLVWTSQFPDCLKGVTGEELKKQ
ncbi:MAG: endo-1,4-beta-xylanase, partial [Paludibacteraceae bacterium]|nr:endo-1,4-beta-xylanase [Paludibacteraceae bacterium]